MKKVLVSCFVVPWCVLVIGSLFYGLDCFAATTRVVTHGPLLGQITSSSVRVWARTNGPGTIEFRYGEDVASLDGVSQSIETSAAHDFTGWTTLDDLDPDTEYVASVFIDGNPAGVPATFQTLPDSKALSDSAHNPRGPL